MTNSKKSSTSLWDVKVDGTLLGDEIMGLMLYGMVEDNLRLPHMFVLSFFDPQREVVGLGKFGLGKEVEIIVVDTKHTAGVTLFKGEVTAMEAQLDGDKPLTVIRGFDKTNRLYRGRKSRTFSDVTYSDVVKQVAQDNRLQIGRVDASPGGVHRHVAQTAMSDADFLSMLAGEVGFVLTTKDGKIEFQGPPPASAAPAAGRHTQQDSLQLVPKEDLLQFSAVVTADSAVKEVEVRGWDIDRAEAAVGTAPARASTSAVGVAPKAIAEEFGSPRFLAASVPFANTSEAETAASALADQIGGTHAQLYGTSIGNPEMKAGVAVSLGAAGTPFNGKYTLSVTRHVYDNGLYRTHFSSTGTHERSLQSMTSNGGGGAAANPAFVTRGIPGVVTGIVTDVSQSGGSDRSLTGLARCKVKIPQFGDDFVTGWLRVVSLGGGADRGLTVLPEVNDEVVVAFDHGDIRRGYVLGGVYNGKAKPEQPAFEGVVNSSDGMVDKRAFTSRKGHFLLFSDKNGAEAVEVATKESKYSIKLDKDGQVIVINSDKEIKVDSKGNITIKAAQNGNITVEATGDLVLKGKSVSIEATTDAEVKGANLKLEGTAQAELKAVTTKVAASAMLDLNGGAMAKLKAGMVNINPPG